MLDRPEFDARPNGDTNLSSDRPNINPSGSFTWDRRRATFTNNGYYVTTLGTNNLPLANSQVGGATRRATANGGAALDDRPGPDEEIHPVGPPDLHGAG